MTPGEFRRSGSSRSPLQQVKHKVRAAHWRDDLQAVGQRPYSLDQLARDDAALVERASLGLGAPHALDQAVGHTDAGYFVGQELGLQQTLERPQTDDDRD